jgi:thioredoxin 1
MPFTSAYANLEPTRAEINAIPGPLVVEFGAPWCGHCTAVQPVLSDLLARFPHVQHIKIHDGKGQPLGRSFRVKLWPSLVFLRDGKVMLQLARPREGQIRQGLDAIHATAVDLAPYNGDEPATPGETSHVANPAASDQ